jgi:hypothetical protein
MNGFLKHWREERALERRRTGDTPEKLAEDERSARRETAADDVADVTKRVSASLVASSASPMC